MWAYSLGIFLENIHFTTGTLGAVETKWQGFVQAGEALILNNLKTKVLLFNAQKIQNTAPLLVWIVQQIFTVRNVQFTWLS